MFLEGSTFSIVAIPSSLATTASYPFKVTVAPGSGSELLDILKSMLYDGALNSAR